MLDDFETHPTWYTRDTITATVYCTEVWTPRPMTSSRVDCTWRRTYLECLIYCDSIRHDR